MYDIKTLIENDTNIKFYLNKSNALLEEDSDDGGDNDSDDEMGDDSGEETTHLDIKTKILLRQIKDTIDISDELTTYMISVYGNEFIKQKRRVLKVRELFKIFIINYNEYDDDDKSTILIKFRKIVSNDLKQIQNIIKG